MIATGVPYLFVRFFVPMKASKQENKAGIGSMKLLYSIGLSDMVVVLCHYTRMVHCLCIIASSRRQFAWIHPTGARQFHGCSYPSSFCFGGQYRARLHLKLYQRLSKSWKNLRLWFKLRSGQIEWESLIQAHQALAMEMASIGNGLILPGDPDWQEPPAGKDDWEMVQFRPSKVDVYRFEATNKGVMLNPVSVKSVIHGTTSQ